MLAEALLYAASLPATPAPFRKYLADAVGLWSRGRRQRSAWQPHLARTRAAVLGAMPAAGEAAVVLGSGPLFDVPLIELRQRFPRLLLVDRAHLLPARLAARRAGAELVWRDLSLAAGALIVGLDDTASAWMISLNLLSQLGHNAPEGAERESIDTHLAGLAACPGPVTLITDVSYEVFDRSGRLLERADLLHGRALGMPDQSWDWEVAPLGEEGPTRRVHRVVAFRRWRGAG